MGYSNLPILATGDWIDAAYGNQYWGDNFRALWPYTTQGDLAYATSSSTLTRLGIGSAGQVLRVNPAGTGLEYNNAPAAAGAQIRRNATQSIPNATYTAVLLNDQIWENPSTVWSTGATKLFAPYTGKYLIAAYVGWLANSNGLREAYVSINGGVALAYDSRMAVNGAATRQTMSFITTITAGQYIELYVWQNSGGSLNINALEGVLSMTLVGT